MKLLFTEAAWEDYLHWQAEDPATLRKLNELIKDIRHRPFEGLGKPEPLRARLSGWRSRRITQDHRLVYRVEGTGSEQRVVIAQCRYQY
ncbi:MAG TPA: Txe/YoeB family addiction module toxin [Stellaceae bacterium]|nr:Txe/YoeB family addiction module toxin [Stellaceae bacterium]